ncbi:MAG: exodeoxyribonuclease VII small subunit [Chitinophagales bacterium]
MKTNLTYSTAFDTLEKIVAQMESDEIQVDELAEKVRQAKELIAFCENKLRMVEKEVEKAISEK